jgi:uridylate kinase
MDEDHPRYKRILLKLSGEALKGDEDSCFSKTVITNITREIKQAHDLGVEIAVVIGGGNFFRGDRSNNLELDRAAADYMGMLATIINGIALRDVLEKTGLQVRLVSALEIKAVAEPYMRRAVLRYLENKRVVIFAAGTGSPFFTTDTAAALRAIEIKADIFLKATMVDGAYSADPKKVKNLTKFDRLSYSEVLDKKLKVMDSTAVTLCRENHLPIKIFNITKKGNIVKAITDEHIGTIIC